MPTLTSALIAIAPPPARSAPVPPEAASWDNTPAAVAAAAWLIFYIWAIVQAFG